ncbi:transmembrane protein-like [Tropilaelaps mercedesae]|uniref:Transmembrane protein-like n=1 Tax=Tropilaelaps mercedesae TaxID=418985 RepID=A0A1V9Y235_9ACAR|nr:transmembrane protein-like [Tropilaelaps mercedesae]
MALTAVFVTGWSFWIYLLLQLWNRKLELFSDYKNYFLAYVGISAGIAFLVCYRWGPPKEQRTIDTMQFLMQFLALVGVYFSSDIPEVTLAICVVAVMLYNFPEKLSARLKTWLKRRQVNEDSFMFEHSKRYLSLMEGRCFRLWDALVFFRPKIKLLTEEEYIRQGDETTAAELEKLRSFARSPDCNAWKVMSRLKDPSRFGTFVMGGSHLQDSEILEYETGGPLFDDDASLTHDESEDEASDIPQATLDRRLLSDGGRGGARWHFFEGGSSSQTNANGDVTGNHTRFHHSHQHRA